LLDDMLGNLCGCQFGGFHEFCVIDVTLCRLFQSESGWFSKYSGRAGFGRADFHKQLVAKAWLSGGI
jgi:hypothetical protein